MALSDLNISYARALAKTLGCEGVIIIAVDEVPPQKYAMVSYGADKRKCGFMGKALDRIRDRMLKGEIFK